MIRSRLFLGAMAAGLKGSHIQARDDADIDDPWALSGRGLPRDCRRGEPM